MLSKTSCRNSSFARIASGLNSPDEVVGKTDYDFPWKKEESDFFRQCDARVMGTDTPEYHIIEPQLQADGKQAWVETNKIPLHDTEGNVVGILGTYEDITERRLAEEALTKAKEELEIRVEERTTELKSANEQLRSEIAYRLQVEERLRKSQEMLQLVMDNIPQFICWKDRNSVYLGCNRNNARLAGVGSPENIVDKTDYDLPWRKEEADFFRQSDIRVMETDTPEYHIIEPIRQADGTQAWLDTNKIPLHDSAGNVVGILVTIEDITERKRAEEEIRKTLEKEKELVELKSNFITMVPHEFRTPLATLLNSSELLLYYGKNFSPDKQQKHLNKIKAEVNNMTHLLEKILFIGKVGSDQVNFNPVQLNLEAFCRKILEGMELEDGKNHSFAFECHGDCSMIEVDEKLILQMLKSLLSNAIKYSPQGSIVHLNLSCGQGQAIFKIRDEGMGIPESDRERLFEVFKRGSNVGNISGTGLGMAIIKNAVELHGGTITFESEVSVGTSFTVSIPTSQNNATRACL